VRKVVYMCHVDFQSSTRTQSSWGSPFSHHNHTQEQKKTQDVSINIFKPKDLKQTAHLKNIASEKIQQNKIDRISNSMFKKTWPADEFDFTEKQLTLQRQSLQNAGINFDINSTCVDQTVQQKSTDLEKLMCKLNNVQILTMTAFIEQNRDKLKALAQENPNGLYIRREVSELPLSLLITPTGRFIWETKRKGSCEASMGDNFKVLYKCVEHDQQKVYVSGSMAMDAAFPYRKAVAMREVVGSLALQGLPHVAQVVHVMSYLSKPAKAKTHEAAKIKIITEYYSEGDLRRVFKNHSALLMQKLEQIISMLIEGIAAIHTAGWIHGDLKPENIFFDEHLDPYIGDFGCVHKQSESCETGYIPYFHPDFYRLVATRTLLEQQDQAVIQQKQDLFALGLILAQIVLKRPIPFCSVGEVTHILSSTQLPFQKKWVMVMESLKKNLTVCDKIPAQTLAQKFIKRLVTPQLSQVPTASQAKQIWQELYTNRVDP
jgi:serine/threonine protein kinase